MKVAEIRLKSLEDVRKDLLAAEDNIRKMRFQLVTHQLENTSQYGKVKTEIARLKTILREHEMGIRPLGVPTAASGVPPGSPWPRSSRSPFW